MYSIFASNKYVMLAGWLYYVISISAKFCVLIVGMQCKQDYNLAIEYNYLGFSLFAIVKCN